MVDLYLGQICAVASKASYGENFEIYKEYLTKKGYTLVKEKGESGNGGFHATCLEKITKNGEKEVVVAIEGSADRWDIISDIRMAWNKIDKQGTQAIQFCEEIQNAYPDAKITVTGHSLGGALALTCGSVHPEYEVVAFCPPGVNGMTVELPDGRGTHTIDIGNNASIFVSKGDPVSGFGSVGKEACLISADFGDITFRLLSCSLGEIIWNNESDGFERDFLYRLGTPPFVKVLDTCYGLFCLHSSGNWLDYFDVNITNGCEIPVNGLQIYALTMAMEELEDLGISLTNNNTLTLDAESLKPYLDAYTAMQTAITDIQKASTQAISLNGTKAIRPYTLAENLASPVTLDLNGDGIITSYVLDNYVNFDLNVDGILARAA